MEDFDSMLERMRIEAYEKNEKAFDSFCEEAEPIIEKIGELVDVLKAIDESYEGYDFSDDIEDMIMELL